MPRFYTTEQIGPKRELTPEGYLVCHDVPIARTGIMLYDQSEMPEDAVHARKVRNGSPVQVFRSDREVFRPETIASANGKPVVNEHPTEDISPRNHRDLAVGHMQNPRRGAAPDDDLLLADMILTDPDAIAAVMAGKREVSCGYDADYFDEASRPGWAEQRNIIMNHLALVHEGRCGQRCAIGDVHRKVEERVMNRNPLTRFIDRVRNAARDEDPGKLVQALTDQEEPNGEHTHIHLHSGEEKKDQSAAGDPMMSKLDEICGLLQKLIGGQEDARRRDEEPPKSEEKEGKEEAASTAAVDEELETTGDRARAKDSSALVDAFQRSVSGAEILAPGIRIPTFDKALPVIDGYKQLCGFRRLALDQGYARSDTRDLIEAANGGRVLDVSRMSCDAVRTVFHASVALKKADVSRNHVGAAAGASGSGMGIAGRVRSLAELNKLNAEFYKK